MAKTLRVTSFEEGKPPQDMTLKELQNTYGLEHEDRISVRHLLFDHEITLCDLNDEPYIRVKRIANEPDPKFSRAVVAEAVQKALDNVQSEFGPFNAAKGSAQLSKHASRDEVIAYGRFVALDELADTLELDVHVKRV
jgi:hypothetical protein